MTIDAVAWHDRTRANHDEQTDKFAAGGYRTLSLALYGTRDDPRYAAVMVKRPTVHASQQFAALSATEFQKTFDDMSAKKFGPYIVAATGPSDNPLFAAVFRPMAPTPLTRFGITAQQLAQMNYDAWINGLIPASIDAYGAPGDLRFIVTWHPNSARLAWNLEAASDPTDLATRQARFNAITTQGARPTFITMVPGARYLGLFVNNQVGGWNSRADMTSAGYQTAYDEAVKAGRQAICVAAEGVGDKARFSAIFADREQPVDRVWNAQGPTTVDGLDNAMKTFMQAHGVRAAALAVTHDTRLLYAKGYTWAEPSYPVTQPTTCFRIASMSKTFAAAAIYRLEQEGIKTPDGAAFTLDTTMQSILKLKTPTGGEPMDPRFKAVTIRHLLESISSIDQGLIWWHVQAAEAFGSPLPCTADQLASYCASLPLGEKDPGDTTNVVYGNADYFLLSQIVRKLCKTATFEEALTQKVLKPLGITRVRGARSLEADQLPDEVHHHEVNVRPVRVLNDDGTPAFNPDGSPSYRDYRSLDIGPSTRTPDRPLAPHAYGGDAYEILDGCGGLSAAVTDYARLVAALNLGSANPVFTPATLEKWFRNAVKATGYTGPEDHGFHGFDSANFWQPTHPPMEAGNFNADKGGWLPSHGSYVAFNVGSYGYIATLNDGGQADVKVDWFRDLDGDGNPNGSADAASVVGVVNSNPWGAIDLFDKFGMSPFNSAPAKPGGAPLKPPASHPFPGAAETVGRVRVSVDTQRARAARPLSRVTGR